MENKKKDFKNFPCCNKAPFEHKLRRTVQEVAGDSMFATTSSCLKTGIISSLPLLGNSVLINSARGMARAGKFELAKGHTEPFGAVNTVERSGCVAFVAYNLLVLCGKEGLCSFNEIVRMEVIK